MTSFNKPDIRYEKLRDLTQKREDRIEKLSNEVLTPTENEELIDLASGIKDKAERLLRETHKTASKKYIPVDDEETRAAVARLDPTQPDGSKITHELFTKLSEKYTTPLSENEMLTFVGGITGVASIDSRLVTQTKSTRGGQTGMLMDAAMHAAILYALGTLLAGYMGNESAKQVSQVSPSSASSGSASSWLMAIAMLAAQHNGGDEKMAEFIKRVVGENELVGGVMQDAMKVLKSENLTPDTLRTNVDSHDPGIAHIRAGGDEHMVQDYANNHIVSNPDFMDWAMEDELRTTASQMDATIDETKKWSSSLGALAGTPADIGKIVYCNLTNKNLNLDMTASLLSDHYAADMICCAVRWLGAGFSTDSLKTLRTMLKFQAKGMTIDLKQINSKLQDMMRDRLYAAIMRPMIGKIRKFFKEISKDVTEWLDPHSHVDPDASPEEREKQLQRWQQLFTCTPIDEMIRHLLKALESMEKFIIAALNRLWKLTKFQNKGWRKKLGQSGDLKSLNSQIRMLDALIDAIEKGNLCGSQDTVYPDEDSIRKVAKGILEGTDMDMNLAPPDNKKDDPFWRFNPVSFKTPSGIQIAPWEVSKAKSVDITEVAAKDCIKAQTDKLAMPLKVSPYTKEVMRDVRDLREELGDRYFRV